MTCYHPIRAYQESPGAPLVFKRSAKDGAPLDIPCGQCIGCRLERSRQWAVRCVHEASLYEDNIFLTLTYADENLPPYRSLNIRDYQTFMKRLRKKESRSPTNNIRFFHCGEYGSYTGRPHYHALIFNYRPTDLEQVDENNGNALYASSELAKLWGLGNITVGDLTFESAAYTARYCVKKRTGPNAAKHYRRISKETGEVYSIQPEYATMSRRPGIGVPWLRKYQSDVYNFDHVVLNGVRMKPPKSYDALLKKIDPALHEEISYNRHAAAQLHHENQTPERLLVREELQHLRAERLERNL